MTKRPIVEHSYSRAEWWRIDKDKYLHLIDYLLGVTYAVTYSNRIDLS